MIAHAPTRRLAAGLQQPLHAVAAAMLLTVLSLSPALSAELAVKVENLSKPVLCAEEDNITLTLAAPDVRSFRIEAVHPAYLAALREDNSDADWTACDFGPVAEQQKQAAAAGASGAAAAPATAKPAPAVLPERVTLYEAVDKWLIGVRFQNFWREATATVRVGDQVTRNLSLIQLWRVRPNGGEEVLVLYPQDGYWRARPMPLYTPWVPPCAARRHTHDIGQPGLCALWLVAMRRPDRKRCRAIMGDPPAAGVRPFEKETNFRIARRDLRFLR